MPTIAAGGNEQSDVACVNVNARGSTVVLKGQIHGADLDREDIFKSLVMADPKIPPIVKAALPKLLEACGDERERHKAWYRLKNNELLWAETAVLRRVEDCAVSCNMPLTAW